jgi:hypothetical protein
MGLDNTDQGPKAERLTQLADLHRKGVLSDGEYEAATARVVGRSPSSLEQSPNERRTVSTA